MGQNTNQTATTTETVIPSPGIRSFSRFTKAVGISDITGWRLRKRGLLKTINIAGRLYITDTEIERFIQRATTGEFSQDTTSQLRPKAA